MKPNYRRCLSCRRVELKEVFWRIVRVYPSLKVQLDQGMGRSAYLCPQASCLEAARKKNRLGRSLKTSIPEELYQTLWQRLSAKEAAETFGELHGSQRVSAPSPSEKQSLESRRN